MNENITQEEVQARIEGLDEDTQKQVVCALVGHSRIQTACFGYWHCARCEAKVGDSLAGAYDGADAVLVGHDCGVCRKNFNELTWRDKFLSPDPFAKEEKGND